MGCCFSQNRATGAGASARRCQPEDRSPPSSVEETVKEVLSETPSAKPRPEPATNVAAPKERDVQKAKKKNRADAAASDLGSSCVSLSLATDEVSEAASESSVATSFPAGPERSPGKLKPARRRPVSADLGPARRDRAVVAASYGVRRSRSARGSPSPPPRRSPSPSAKRPSEQRRAASPVASAQRKPPVPVRPSGRVSPRRARAEAPPPIFSTPSLSQPEDDAVTVSSEASVPNAGAGGDVNRVDRGVDGKESLENPLVSLECFIFL